MRKILETATPIIIRQGWVDINLASEELKIPNVYEKFEEQSGGVVRFFQVAKSKISSFFKPKATAQEPLPDQQVGTIPKSLAVPVPAPVDADANPEEVDLTEVEASVSEVADQVAQMNAAVEEIMAAAVPVASPKFDESKLHNQAPIAEDNGTTPNQRVESKAQTTLVAVVDGKVVPGVERIKSQIKHAAGTGEVLGMERFIARLSAVLGERKHSFDDLMQFLERGDLPVADDGSIVIYKVLRRDGNKPGRYLDCHTKRVSQGIGSRVCMDHSLVDHNRNNECSNGLHVARRGYLGGFPGDVCVLAKLAPEDVISVPRYDANKMRVCAYHIVAELPEEMYQKLRNNKPITDTPEGRALLADVLAGNHIGVTEEVRITQHNGGGVVITPAKQKPTSAVPETPPTKATKEVAALDNDPHASTKVEPVNPADVTKTVIVLSRKDTAQGLYDTYQHATDPAEKATALQALKDYKKSSKVGWAALGLAHMAEQQVPASGKEPQATKAAAGSKETKKMPTTTATTKNKGKEASDTPRQQVAKLLPEFESATGQQKTALAHDILKIKQAAKKSWEILGVSEDIQKQIKLRTS